MVKEIDITIHKNRDIGRVEVTTLPLDWCLWSLRKGVHKAEGIGRRMKYQQASRERSILLSYVEAKQMSIQELSAAIHSLSNPNPFMEKGEWRNLQLHIFRVVLEMKQVFLVEVL